MPLQNRVAPDGSIVADQGRGLLMGNRGGQLHDDHRRLGRRRWVSKAWIACVLSYKGRHEVIMAPHHYTQLFFLDEATALAAGHRPCALCRRPDFNTFIAIWAQIRGIARRPLVAEVDGVLHQERLRRIGGAKIPATRLADLPFGAMLSIDGLFYLYNDRLLWPWSFGGYGVPIAADRDLRVSVLTPPSILAVLAGGYAPLLHDSARWMSVARST